LLLLHSLPKSFTEILPVANRQEVSCVHLPLRKSTMPDNAQPPSSSRYSPKPPFGIGYNSSKPKKGYFRSFKKPKRSSPIRLTPEGAKRYYSTRKAPDLWKPPSPSGKSTRTTGQPQTEANVAAASNVVPGPPSITELARALKNDVDVIYEWVTNNINFYPVWGHFKGGFGALVDQRGTSFDIAELMILLLRESGYTANFVFGQIGLSGIEASNWLGIGIDNSGFFSGLVGFGGIPFQNGTNGDGSLSGAVMSHVWVRVTIDGVDYDFDPSFKQMVQSTGIDLASAMDYDRTSFMSDADEGATITDDFIENINRANIRDDLATMTGNLIEWVQTNMPGATMQDILGGQTIVPFSGVLRQTRLPHELPDDDPEVWTSIPSQYEHTMEISINDIDVTLASSDLSGHRLTLWWNDSLEPVLYLDGTVVATGSAGEPGEGNLIQFTIIHPYNVTIGVAIFVETDQDFLIENSWGHTSRNNVERHRAILALNQFNGGNATDEDVLGESLAVVGTTVDATMSMMSDIYDAMYGLTSIIHNALWLIQNDGTTMTNGLDTFAGGIATQDNSLTGNVFLAEELLVHATETLSLETAAGIPSVGAATIIDLETILGGKVYDANSDNWSTDVRPNLINWDSDTLDNIEDNFIDEGWRIILPEDGALSKNEWTGFAWYPLMSGSGITAALGTSAKGGIATEDQDPAGLNENAQQNQKPDPIPDETSDEPIDLFTGSYMYDHVDMSVGSSQFPYRLSFTRSYRSANRLTNGPLGLGWTHNFNLQVTQGKDPFIGLGDDEPLKALASLVAMYVIADLFIDEVTTPIDQFTATQVISRWWLDQISNNTATINFPSAAKQFALLGNGTYYSGADGCTFTPNDDGTFTYTTAQKAQYNFFANGQLNTYVTPAGVTVQCTYTSGNLTSVSNGLGRQLNITYSGDFISEVSDGNGRTISFTVDGNNLTSFENATGDSTTYAYDESNPGLLTQFFSPANPDNAVITNAYDTLFRVQTQTDAFGNIWNYFFAGARSEEVDPLGNSHVLHYDRFGKVLRDINALRQETDYEYDGRKLLMQVTLPEGNNTLYDYDLNGNRLSSTFIAKPGSGLDDITNTFTYNMSFNKVATATDGNGNTTTFGYDSDTGSLLTIERPQVDEATPEVVNTYNDRGQVLTVTDETGIVTQFNYDADTEKLLSVVVDYGSGDHLNLTTAFGYDDVGNVTSITDPNSNETTFEFDDERRKTQQTAASPFSFITNYGYNQNGRLTSVERQIGGSPASQTYSMTYSVLNKLLTATDPLSNVTTYFYDERNRLSTVTDAEGRVTQNFYDALSRIASIKDASGTIADARTYTPNGKLSQRSDARGNSTVYAYDGFDRRTTATFADGSFNENQSYDANGNVLIFATRSGNTITNTFDVLNRLSTKAPEGQATVTFGYDLHGRLTSVSKPVVDGDPSTGEFQFAFDSAGRFFQETTPDSKEITCQLDGNGNITKLTYPDSYFVDREFDELNRLTSVTLNGASSPSLSFDYDDLSRRTQLIYGNGAVVNYEYQLNNDMTSLEQVFNGTTSVEFTYGFNGVHQEISRSVSDGTYLSEPDASDTTVYGVSNGVNEYPSVAGTAFSYDGNGNLTSDGTLTNTFDTENHLTAASKTGTAVSYLYDGSHRQIQRTVNSTKSRYVYRRFQRIADYDGTSGDLQTRYVYGVGLDEPLIAVASDGTLTYLHADRLGSLIATTNSSGDVSNQNSYSPFGEGTVTGTTFGFTGQRYDSETGWYFYKRRYYSPAIGRFLQSDPIGYRGGLNLYAYVGNDPLNLFDPNGLMSNRANQSTIPSVLGIIGSPVGDKGDGFDVEGDDSGLNNFLGYESIQNQSQPQQIAQNQQSDTESTGDTSDSEQTVYHNPDGSTTYVNANGSYVTEFPDGGYVVHDSQGYAQYFDADGNPLTDPMEFNPVPSGGTLGPVVPPTNGIPPIVAPPTPDEYYGPRGGTA
jgi:RHS repeat-associated protein